jgi:hypothetical protein
MLPKKCSSEARDSLSDPSIDPTLGDGVFHKREMYAVPWRTPKPGQGDQSPKSRQASGQEARFQTMFADDLKAAHTSNNRLEVCRLIKSIPASRWTFHAAHAAMTSYEGVGIAAFSSGGGGINSYDEISIAVFWPDGTLERPGYLGRFSKDELRLPNYAPTDTWSF